MELLVRAYAQIFGLFGSLPPRSRWMASLLATVILVSLGYISFSPTARPTSDLMHGVPLTPGQLPAMEAAFAKANLKGYEIRGTSIFVPRGRESAYMAALAAAGALPPNFGDPSNKAAGAASIFESNQQREERLKNALQDELALNIRSMYGIENASVLYDIDGKNGFNQEKVRTAAVSVKPAGGAQLDADRVDSIRRYVAGAIAGLNPENVTVSDLSNGRTWSGKLDESGLAQNRLVALRRVCEQELKTKVLGALRFIPNVTVEPNILLDGERIVQVRVSVGVPDSYFKRIWREQHPDAPGRLSQTPDPAELDQICAEETKKIQRHVAPLLPTTAPMTDAANLVAVNSFQDVSLSEPASSAIVWEAWEWLRKSWRMVALVGSILIGLFWLRTVVRGATASRNSTSETAGGSGDPATKRSPVGPPHWQQRRGAADPSPGEELSAWVENDPETAAGILRNWIGQGN